MHGNMPIKGYRAFPLTTAHASCDLKDGFVPVTSAFGRSQCGCNDCCDNASYSGCNNDCGCNDCCDNAAYSSCNNDCGCNDCCDNASYSSCNNDCGCNDCCDNAAYSSCNNDCGCNDCCDNASYSSCNNDCGCNDCCDNATYSSCNNDCGCNDCCDNATYSSCNNDCGCDNNRCQCQTAGMVYSADHCLKNRMNAAQGIRQGTLFTELHKPFSANPCPSGSACATDRQALAFAAWELRLYLNTHPHDKAALKLFEEYERRLNCENYATTFVPGCKGRNRWTWNQDPWPWEVGANGRKE